MIISKLNIIFLDVHVLEIEDSHTGRLPIVLMIEGAEGNHGHGLGVPFDTHTDLVVFSEIECPQTKPEIVEPEVLLHLGVKVNVVFLAQVDMVTAVALLVGLELTN